jgi:hypothetical protein
MKPKAGSDSIASRLSLPGALAFVKRQLENPRPATRRKAERFLQRWAK